MDHTEIFIFSVFEVINYCRLESFMTVVWILTKMQLFTSIHQIQRQSILYLINTSYVRHIEIQNRKTQEELGSHVAFLIDGLWRNNNEISVVRFISSYRVL